MTQYGTWIPYAGSHAVLLAVALLVVATVLAFLGTRLKAPRCVKTPGWTGAVFMIAIWLLSIYTFLVAIVTYAVQLKQVNLLGTAPSSPISVVTGACAVGTFVIIVFLTWKHGVKLALLSAFVGAAAALMIFELPFDLIVMNMTYPPIPPYPVLYRELFFFPLFIVEFSTVSLLTLSPLTRVSRHTFFSLAGMFLVFAVWAFLGFQYPTSLTFIALNDVSKALCFVVTITLFLGDRTKREDLRVATAPPPSQGI